MNKVNPRGYLGRQDWLWRALTKGTKNRADGYGAAARVRSPSWPLWLVATDLAARLMSGSKCTSRAKPRSAHESGNSRTNREGSLLRWSDSLQLRPGGGAIRPVGGAIRPTRQPAHCLKWQSRTNREIRALIGNGAHESGTAVHEIDSAAACGRRTPGGWRRRRRTRSTPAPEIRSRPRFLELWGGRRRRMPSDCGRFTPC